MGKRMQGRRGQAALKRRKAAHPFCAHCAARGIVKAAAQMDHILALALGGEDVDSNIQGLCIPCHAIKTAMEDASGGAATNHPEWLRPASCHLTIVTGPPCAGKSTWVRDAAGPLDVVIDLDDIASRIDPSFARRWTGDLLNRSIRARNSLLGSLSTMPPRAAAWFVIGAPTAAERAWWHDKLKPADSVHLDPGKDVCMRRAQLRTHTQREGWEQQQIVAEWYQLARQPWRPKASRPKRQAIGADGYPVEE